MKTGNYKEVYITQNSCSSVAKIWNPNIGIAKFNGCVEFYSARSVGKHGFVEEKEYVGQLDIVWPQEVRKQFGLSLKPGTAWLYNTTGKRTRVDKEMALIDPDTGKVIG
jgi:hypothetical protein